MADKPNIMPGKDSNPNSEQQEHMQIATLHRYYIHTTLLKQHFESELMKGEYITTEHKDPTMNAVMTAMKLRVMPVGTFMEYWYGGLYVVCEGWKDLGLKDQAIDKLLDDPKLELLRRFRNAAFHYQKDYLSTKYLEFTGDSESVEYVRSLSKELGRWFLNWFKNHKNESQEMHKSQPNHHSRRNVPE